MRGINGKCASEYLVVCLSASPAMTIVGNQDVELCTHKPSIDFRHGYPSSSQGQLLCCLHSLSATVMITISELQMH